MPEPTCDEMIVLAESLRRYVETGNPVAYYRRNLADGKKRITWDLDSELFEALNR